jgi:hypothetical protein
LQFLYDYEVHRENWGLEEAVRLANEGAAKEFQNRADEEAHHAAKNARRATKKGAAKGYQTDIIA